MSASMLYFMLPLELFLILSYLSRSLAERWGTTVDFTTSFLHSPWFSAFHSMMFHSRPVHSLMLFSHHFLCLPLHLPPWTVPCGIVLASPDDCVMCPYHLSLHLFTEVRRSSNGPMAFPILAFTALFKCDLCMRYCLCSANLTFYLSRFLRQPVLWHRRPTERGKGFVFCFVCYCFFVCLYAC